MTLSSFLSIQQVFYLPFLLSRALKNKNNILRKKKHHRLYCSVTFIYKNGVTLQDFHDPQKPTSATLYSIKPWESHREISFADTKFKTQLTVCTVRLRV